MVLQHFPAQGGHIYVGVNLRSAYLLVPQHGLYGTQRRAALQQCGGFCFVKIVYKI